MPQCPKLLWVMIVFMVACFSVLKKTAQKQVCIRSFSFIVAKSSRTSIKQSQTLTTHNANRHCRVRFHTFLDNLCRNSCIPGSMACDHSDKDM